MVISANEPLITCVGSVGALQVRVLDKTVTEGGIHLGRQAQDVVGNVLREVSVQYFKLPSVI